MKYMCLYICMHKARNSQNFHLTWNKLFGTSQIPYKHIHNNHIYDVKCSTTANLDHQPRHKWNGGSQSFSSTCFHAPRHIHTICNECVRVVSFWYSKSIAAATTKATTNYKESLYISTCVSHLNMHERVSVRVSGAEVATHTPQQGNWDCDTQLYWTWWWCSLWMGIIIHN